MIGNLQNDRAVEGAEWRTSRNNDKTVSRLFQGQFRFRSVLFKGTVYRETDNEFVVRRRCYLRKLKLITSRLRVSIRMKRDANSKADKPLHSGWKWVQILRWTVQRAHVYDFEMDMPVWDISSPANRLEEWHHTSHYQILPWVNQDTPRP